MDTCADKKGGKRKKEIRKTVLEPLINSILKLARGSSCKSFYIQHDYDYFKIDQVKRIGLVIFFLFYISSNIWRTLYYS